MAIQAEPYGPYEKRTSHPGTYELVLRCETNSTSAPDGADPSYGTWGRTGAGLITWTFPTGAYPSRVLYGHAYVEESDATLSAGYTGYTAATGVCTVSLYTEGAGGTGTGDGIKAVADTTNKTLVLVLCCTDGDLHPA